MPDPSQEGIFCEGLNKVGFYYIIYAVLKEERINVKRLHDGETYVVSAFRDGAHGILGVFDDLEVALQSARNATEVYFQPRVLDHLGSFIWRCLNNVFDSKAVPIFKREYIRPSVYDKERSWVEEWHSPAHEALAKKFS